MSNVIEWKRDCRSCQVTKPIVEFERKDVSGKTGVKGRRVCRTCLRAQAAAHARMKRSDPIVNDQINERRRKRKLDPNYRPRYETQQAAAYQRHKQKSLEYQRKKRAIYDDGVARVYFILSVELERVKIGYAKGHPQARLNSMVTGSADELRLLGWVPGTRLLEKQLHDRFVHDRIRREWFKLSAELGTYIAENACKL